MEKVADESTSVALFEVIGQYFSFARTLDVSRPTFFRDSDAVLAYAEKWITDPEDSDSELISVLATVPEHRDRLIAIVALSLVGESILDSFFSHSDTVGPLMRRKLSPWTEPVLKQIRCLQE